MVKDCPLSTDLVGEKTLKTNEKINFFGDLDEASALIMEFSHYVDDNFLKKELKNIVKTLSVAMAETAGAKVTLSEENLTGLENLVNEYNKKGGKFNGFTLPGETILGAKAHVVRTVVRRAERSYAKVYQSNGGSKVVFEYLNKLSTLFYAIATIYDKQ